LRVTGPPAGAWASIRSLEVYDRPFSADLRTYKAISRNSGKAAVGGRRWAYVTVGPCGFSWGACDRWWMFNSGCLLRPS
jgi:hypothetical protein